MNEGPGHVPMHMIKENMEKKSNGAMKHLLHAWSIDD